MDVVFDGTAAPEKPIVTAASATIRRRIIFAMSAFTFGAERDVERKAWFRFLSFG